MPVEVTGTTKVSKKAPPKETQAVASKETVAGLLEKLKPQIERALPMHMPADRFVRVVLTTLRNNPALVKADPFSLMGAIMTAAQLGLEPDGVLGHGYLVPFNSRQGPKVQFIPGYRGYITLARNSGEVEHIAAECVYEADEFDYELGLDPKLKHKPAPGDRGAMLYVYAVAKYKGGGHSMVVLTREDCEAVRKQFSAAFRKYGDKADTPWVTHFEAMCRKTAIRRLSNMLPLSVQRAAALETLYESGRGGTLGDLGEVVPEAPDADDDVVDGEEVADESASAPAGDDGGGETVSEPRKSKGEAPAASGGDSEGIHEGEPDPSPLTDEEKEAIKAAERSEYERGKEKFAEQKQELLDQVEKTAEEAREREPGED